MFYKRINLRKLYEAADDLLSDGMPIDPTAAPKEPGTDNIEASATEETSNNVDSSVSNVTNKSSNEIVNISKGNTYALPLSKSDADELTKLAEQGSGTEWKSSSPLKSLMSGRDGNPATLMLGQSEKPVYLIVKLVNNKADQKAMSLSLDEEDRYYVAWITSPPALLDNLEAATDITNSIKVAVKTPAIDKNGNNVEHSLQVWKDYEDGSTDSNSTNQSTDEPQTMIDITGEEDAAKPEITDVEVDTDLAMQAPGTSAGFDATVESAKAVSSFDEYLKKLK
jgi:hypothetical protein